jgi:MFS family permease
MIAWGTTTVVVPRQVGRLIPRYGERVFIAAGMALHAGSLLWFALEAEPDRSYLWLVAPLVFSGAGCALAIPAAQSLTLRAVDGPQIGPAAGAFSMLRQLGGATGVAAMVAGFVAAGGYTNRTSFSHGFTAALVIGAALAAVAGVAGGGLPRPDRPVSDPVGVHPYENLTTGPGGVPAHG